MDEWQNEPLTDAEVYALFDRLLPYGVAAADVFAEVVPHGWKQSPLLACFHPSVARCMGAILAAGRLRDSRSAIKPTQERA